MADTVFCTKCGTRCSGSDAFCPNCGAKFDSPAVPAAPAATARVNRVAMTQTAPLSGFSLTRLIVLAVSVIQIFLLLLPKWISFDLGELTYGIIGDGLSLELGSFFSSFSYSYFLDTGSIIVLTLFTLLLILCTIFMFGYAIAKLLFGDKVHFADKLPLVGGNPVRWCLVASALSAIIAIFIGIFAAVINSEVGSSSAFSMAAGPIVSLVLAVLTEALWVSPLRNILDKIVLK